jgi:hypothetical protein
MSQPDPRLTLARPDLAAASLEGVVRARRYEKTSLMRCAVPTTAIRRSPLDDGEQLDQLLFGEMFDVLEQRDGWCWGQARRDGYVGHVALADLATHDLTPSHWVSVLSALAFAEPDFKAAPAGPYPLNSLVTIEAQEGRFACAAGAGWFAESQLLAVGRHLEDVAAVAEGFAGAPYLWGGRAADGVDCSGLVQQALLACGHGCPRDADMQQALGRPIEPDQLRRGDLVFWPGHVAMMLDGVSIVHANTRAMAVTVEPLAEVQRLRASEPMSCRRLEGRS